MTGLENMIKQIETEAENAAAGILSEGEGQAEALLEKARSDCREIRTEAEAEGSRRAKEIQEKAHSASAMKKKREILSAKQRLLAETLEKARRSLGELEAGAYFRLIISMAEKYVQPLEGEILFSPKDKERLPKEVEKELFSIAEKRGGTLKISQETCHIDGGFLLRYGGVEENCSFEAVFRAQEEELKDRISTVLFS